MHVALLLDAGGAVPGVDAADTVAMLSAAAREVDRRATPLALAVGGTALRSARERDGALVEAVASGVDWIRSAWSSPELTSLPDPVVERALVHEAEVIEGLGGTPGPLWVRGPWDHRLPAVVAGAGVGALLLDGGRVDRRQPGVVHHLDVVLPAFPVTPRPDEPARTIAGFPGSDGLAIWSIVDPDELPHLVDLLRRTAGCDLTTPSRFLVDHPVAGRLEIRPPAGGTGAETEILRRKLIRLATRLPERPGAAALERTLDGAAAAALDGRAEGPVLTAAHEALIEARRIVDRDRRRGDDWGRVRRIDWDADGRTEVQLELPDLSVVVDPTDAGSLLVLDDKERHWAAGFVPGAGTGRLVRYRSGEPELPPVEMDVASVEEAKGEIVLVLRGSAGNGAITCTLRASGRRLRVTHRLDGAPAGRLGPELVLAMDGVRIRADGAAWRPVDGPLGLAGHRFRLADDRRQVLLGSMIPADCFLRPVPGGVVVWPHWATDGTGSFDLDVDLAPPDPQPESTARSDS